MNIEAMKRALELAHEGVEIHSPNSPEYKVCSALIALAQPEQEPVAWQDKEDEWSYEIAAHHPMKTKAYKQWDTAMAMVGARHSKGALVELVCWLLQKSTPPQRKPLDFGDFFEWANDEGHDTAHTHDGVKWVCLNPMTADLWKTWQAAHGIKGEA